MREARLGEVITSMKNGMYKPASQYADDGTPCLRMYNIDAGSIVWRDIKRMRVSAQEFSEYQLREGDLLVNRVNSRELVGKAAYVPASLEPSVFESKNIRVRLDTSKALPKFVNYQLVARGSRHFANNAQQVVGMASISQGQLANFPIVLTDIDGQRAVVAEIEKQFSRLDEAVANLQRVKANFKRYKAAVLNAAVEGRLIETEAGIARREGRSYESGEQLLEKILETRRDQWLGRGKYKAPMSLLPGPLGPLPDGWTWATADQMTYLITSGSRGWGDFYSDTGVLFIRAQDIKTDVLTLPDIARVDVPSDVEGTRSSVSEGDILVTITGANVTKSAVVPALGETAFVSQHVALLKLCIPATSLFAFSWITSPANGRNTLESWAYGAGKPGLSLQQLRALPIPLPPLAEQVRIVAEVDRRLSTLRELEAEVDVNLRRAQVLRQSVLQKAFAGSGAVEKVQIKLEPVQVVLAARIIAANHQEGTFGKTVLIKTMFVATHHARVESANDRYIRMQAGPLDMPMLERTVKRLNDLGWFRELMGTSRTASDGKRSYEPLTKAEEYKQHLGVFSPDQLKAINDVTKLMRKWSTEDCELFATVYAAWNDLLLTGREPSAEAIIHELHECWHESKLRFRPERIRAEIDKIRSLGYAPTGFGRPTAGNLADTQSGELFGDRGR